jgi:hypothetical protein
MGNKKTKKTFMGRDGYHLPNEIVDYQFWWKLVRIGVKRNRLIEKLEENGKWVLGVGDDAEVKGDKKRWEKLDVSRRVLKQSLNTE